MILSAARVAEDHGPGNSHSDGLSIYLPPPPLGVSGSYFSLDFAADAHWINFLNAISTRTLDAPFTLTVGVQGVPCYIGVIWINGTAHTAHIDSPVTISAWLGISYTGQADSDVWVWTGQSYNAYSFQSWSDSGAIRHTITITGNIRQQQSTDLH